MPQSESCIDPCWTLLQRQFDERARMSTASPPGRHSSSGARIRNSPRAGRAYRRQRQVGGVRRSARDCQASRARRFSRDPGTACFARRSLRCRAGELRRCSGPAVKLVRQDVVDQCPRKAKAVCIGSESRENSPSLTSRSREGSTHSCLLQGATSCNSLLGCRRLRPWEWPEHTALRGVLDRTVRRSNYCASRVFQDSAGPRSATIQQREG